MSNSPTVGADTAKPVAPDSNVKPAPQQNQENSKPETKPDAKPTEQQK